MIAHFEVGNFKSIKELSFDLRGFMVFVGPNGAGKTNLIRAMETFGEIIRRGTIEPIQQHGYDQLIRREKKPARAGLHFMAGVELPSAIVERPIRLYSSEKQRDQFTAMLGPVRMEIGIGVMGSIHTDEVEVSYESLRLQSLYSELKVTRSAGGVSVELGEDPVLWLQVAESSFGNVKVYSAVREIERGSSAPIKALIADVFASSTQEQDVDPRLLQLVNWQRRPSRAMQYFRDVCQVSTLRLDASVLRRDSSYEEGRDSLGPTGEGLASAVARLRGPKPTPSARFKKVLEALQQVYPRIEDVSAQRIPSGRLMLIFKERGISEHLGQGSISDGVLHALALLVALHQNDSGRSGLLAIEEPENAIHPWPLRKLVAHAQQASRQIILTTHSETVVNAVKEPEALFVVENDDKKGTAVVQATEREAALKSILEESGQRLGDVWLDGTLGGVPGAEP